MRSSVYTKPEFVSVLCCDSRILLLTFPKRFDGEVGTIMYSCKLLSITASSDYIVGKPVNLFLLLLFYLPLRTTKPFLDVVHHWFCLLQWAIWVTKPIYILTFSYRPKSSPILYCKAIYPSGLWLLTNDDCCAKYEVVSRVLTYTCTF